MDRRAEDVDREDGRGEWISRLTGLVFCSLIPLQTCVLLLSQFVDNCFAARAVVDAEVDSKEKEAASMAA